MDTIETINTFAMGEANRGKELMVFDWDKAAKLIKENGATCVSAGLSGDWKWTGGDILKDGMPIPKEETYVFLASTWATPELKIDDEYFDCYKMQSETDNWDAHTYWPDSAIKILEN